MRTKTRTETCCAAFDRQLPVDSSKPSRTPPLTHPITSINITTTQTSPRLLENNSMPHLHRCHPVTLLWLVVTASLAAAATTRTHEHSPQGWCWCCSAANNNSNNNNNKRLAAAWAVAHRSVPTPSNQWQCLLQTSIACRHYSERSAVHHLHAAEAKLVTVASRTSDSIQAVVAAVRSSLSPLENAWSAAARLSQASFAVPHAGAAAAAAYAWFKAAWSSTVSAASSVGCRTRAVLHEASTRVNSITTRQHHAPDPDQQELEQRYNDQHSWHSWHLSTPACISNAAMQCKAVLQELGANTAARCQQAFQCVIKSLVSSTQLVSGTTAGNLLGSWSSMLKPGHQLQRLQQATAWASTQANTAAHAWSARMLPQQQLLEEQESMWERDPVVQGMLQQLRQMQEQQRKMLWRQQPQTAAAKSSSSSESTTDNAAQQPVDVAEVLTSSTQELSVPHAHAAGGHDAGDASAQQLGGAASSTSDVASASHASCSADAAADEQQHAHGQEQQEQEEQQSDLQQTPVLADDALGEDSDIPARSTGSMYPSTPPQHPSAASDTPPTAASTSTLTMLASTSAGRLAMPSAADFLPLSCRLAAGADLPWRLAAKWRLQCVLDTVGHRLADVKTVEASGAREGSSAVGEATGHAERVVTPSQGRSVGSIVPQRVLAGLIEHAQRLSNALQLEDYQPSKEQGPSEQRVASSSEAKHAAPDGGNLKPGQATAGLGVLPTVSTWSGRLAAWWGGSGSTISMGSEQMDVTPTIPATATGTPTTSQVWYQEFVQDAPSTLWCAIRPCAPKSAF